MNETNSGPPESIPIEEAILPQSQRILRNAAYTEILRVFSDNLSASNRQRRRFQMVFFWIICGSYCLVVLFGGFVIYMSVSGPPPLSWENVTGAIAGIGTLVGAFTTLPSIIATHLFPADGDRANYELVQQMQKYDVDTTPLQKEGEIGEFIPLGDTARRS